MTDNGTGSEGLVVKLGGVPYRLDRAGRDSSWHSKLTLVMVHSDLNLCGLWEQKHLTLHAAVRHIFQMGIQKVSQDQFQAQIAANMMLPHLLLGGVLPLVIPQPQLVLRVQDMPRPARDAYIEMYQNVLDPPSIITPDVPRPRIVKG